MPALSTTQLGLSLRVAAVNLQRLLALGLAYDHGWKDCIATHAALAGPG